MDATSNGGALSFLDRLGSGLVNLSTATVTAATNLAQAKINLKAAKQSDLTPANQTTPVQAAPLGIPTAWLVGGVLVLGIGAAWYFGRKG